MFWKQFSLVVLIFTCQLKSQPVITATALPKAGDFFYTSLSATTLDQSYLQGGENLIWDFSTLTYFAHDTIAFYSVVSSQVPLAYAAAFYNPLDPTHKANVCRKGDDIQLGPTVQATKVFHFYKVEPSTYVQVGFGATINNVPTPIKWNPTDTIFNLPLHFNDENNDYSFFEISIPSLGYFCEHRWRHYIVDAYGQVTTPIGTFETLRIKTNMQYKDSMYYEQYGLGFPLHRSETIYEWYTPTFSIPVIKITQNMQGNIIEYIDTTNYAGLTEYMQVPLYVFPNPASTKAHILINHLTIKSIQLFSLAGKCIRRILPDIESSTYTIDISTLPNSLYILQIETNQGIFQEKLLIQK